jgi:hypothetical protein
MHSARSRVAVLLLIVAAATACTSADSDDSPASASSPTTPTSSAAPSADVAVPDASEIVSAFTSAGLPAPNPRDNTAGNCPDLQCVQLVTTDAISVYTFSSEGPAVHFAEAFGTEAHRDGLVVLSYAGARTPAADRPKYEQVLAELL